PIGKLSCLKFMNIIQGERTMINLDDLSSEEKTFVDAIVSHFTMSGNFQNADLIFTTKEFFRHIWQFCPVRISEDRFVQILNQIGFYATLNDENNKYYWILNRKNNV